MQAGRSNISRSVWRFFEIALFFVISVVGFNVCAKTTNLNSKLKSRSQLQGNGSCWLSSNHELHHTTLLHAFSDTRKKNALKRLSIFQAAQCAQRNDVNAYPDEAFRTAPCRLVHATTALPRNLLQQNPVLLI
ncbi:MAG: hypothetical protein K9G39_10880 [Chlorobium sp.]|uniref:hypothetical protein n=1 Tax=Chlorobium sp. TaxID=1095 RepID=UPI0025BD78E5|nr:hypothetical protein [Chlorobium sp.]MCF8384072.1 hypothetical protein [Chlorobium sp.]